MSTLSVSSSSDMIAVFLTSWVWSKSVFMLEYMVRTFQVSICNSLFFLGTGVDDLLVRV